MRGMCSPSQIMLALSLLLLSACALIMVADAQRIPEFPRLNDQPNQCGCPLGESKRGLCSFPVDGASALVWSQAAPIPFQAFGVRHRCLGNRRKKSHIPFSPRSSV